MNGLLLLISRMKPIEKQYFKRYCHAQEGEKKYVALFDELQRLLEKNANDPKPLFAWDDEKMRRHLLQKGIAGNIIRHKNYLLEHLLRSLRLFHESKTARKRLQTELDEAEILLKKGIYELAAERLETLLPELEKHEFFDLEQRTLEKVMSLAQAKTLKRFEDSYQKWMEKRQTLLKKMENLVEMKHRFDSIFLFARQGKPTQSDEVRQQLESLSLQLESLSAENLDSNSSRKSFFHAKAMLSHRFSLKKESQVWMEKVMAIWIEKPHFLEENPAEWSKNASNYLNICHLNKDYTPFPNYLKKIRELHTQHFDDEGEIFQNLAQAELLYRMNQPQIFATQPLPEGVRPDEEFVRWVEAGIKTYHSKINRARLIMLHYNILIWLLSRDRWQEALEKVSLIENLGRSDQRQDIQSVLKIFQLLLYFDLQNNRHLENMVKSARQIISYHDYLFDFERLTLYHFARLATLRQTKLPAEVAAEQTRELLEGFHLDLEKFKEKSAGLRVSGLEEVSIWVEARWQGLSFLEVLQARILNGND